MATRQRRRRRRSAEEGRREPCWKRGGTTSTSARWASRSSTSGCPTSSTGSGSAAAPSTTTGRPRTTTETTSSTSSSRPTSSRTRSGPPMPCRAAWASRSGFEEMARVVADISYHGLELAADRERLTLSLIAHGDRDIDDRLGRPGQRHQRALGRAVQPPTSPPTASSRGRRSRSSRWPSCSWPWSRACTCDARSPRTSVTGELAPGWDLFASSALAFVARRHPPDRGRRGPGGGRAQPVGPRATGRPPPDAPAVVRYRRQMPTRERRSRRQRLPAAEAGRPCSKRGGTTSTSHPLGEPLDHVRIADIVEGLGLSIGAVYHYWECQDDYRDDLLDLLLSPDSTPTCERAGEVVAEAADGRRRPSRTWSGLAAASASTASPSPAGTASV